MKSRSRVLILMVLLLTVAAAISASEKAKTPQQPLTNAEKNLAESAPYSLSASELRAVADTLPLPENSEAVVLLEESHYVYDSQGAVENTYHAIYKVVTQAGADDWSSVASQWDPWYQERPTIRARVLSADGVLHELDPATIDDAPAAEYSADIYSDRRVLRAPLPAIAAGAVVEELIVTRDRTPMFNAGQVHTFGFGKTVAVRQSKLIVDAPEAVQLTFASSTISPTLPARTTTPSGVRYTTSKTLLDPLDDIESFLPYDLSRWQYVAFTNGGSWAAVARSYSDTVDRQLAGSNLRQIAMQTISDAPTREEKIARLLARLHRDVRYTGLELGEASIVPRSPDETFKRKYGDCKDKATALVGLLRAAGIDSYVAVLNVGPGEDVRRELPGFGNFDHAIVFVPGDTPLWIDATAEYAREGEIPEGDQGRFALVAAPSTTDLIRIPDAASTQNRTIVTREFFLTEDGPARIVETTELHGGPEQTYRNYYAGTDKKTIDESSKSYAEEAFLSKKPVSIKFTAPGDLSTHFKMTLEVPQGARGTTEDAQAVVALFPVAITESLPDALRGDLSSTETVKDDEEGAEPKKKRTNDYCIMRPHVEEWHYRIVPPPGYAARTLPADETVSIGPMKFTRTFHRGDDGVVTADLVFDSVKRRFTVAEVESIQKKLREMSSSGALLISFDQLGFAELAAGNVGKALDEFRKLAELHPKEALHHSQIAMALLAGGIGDAARTEAKKAIAIEPKNSKAHRTLGWILQHDLVGRRFRTDFDLQGGIAEYRKAKELDPKDFIARADLAILLEHDADGIRYSQRAQLLDAVKEYKEIRDELKNHALDQNLLFTLLYVGDARQLQEIASTVSDTIAEKKQFVFVARVLNDGIDKAIEELPRVVSDVNARHALLEGAGNMLAQIRKYKEASTLLSLSANGSPSAAALRSRADLIGRTKRHEELTFENDPVGVVKRFLVASLNGRTFDKKTILGFFAKDAAKEAELDPKPFDFSTLTEVMRQNKTSGLPFAFLLDVTLANTKFTSEGSDAAGYRVNVRSTIAASPGEPFFLVKDGADYKILATGQNFYWIGHEALRRANIGDLVGARQWLDWARDDLYAGTSDDPFSGAPFTRLWKKGDDAPLERIRIAAAALMLGQKTMSIDEPLGILKSATASADAPAKMAIESILAFSFLYRGKPAEALPFARDLLKSSPESETAFQVLYTALSETGNCAEVKVIADAWDATSGDDRLGKRALAVCAQRQSDYASVSRLYQAIIDGGRADSSDYNNKAWVALFFNPIPPSAIEDAQQAVAIEGHDNPVELHTLAALYADLGRTSEARETILKSIEASDDDAPAPSDWYVLGRIAEQYGVTDAAIAAYGRVTKPERESDMSSSTYLLAQRRLEIIRGSTARPATK